MLSVTVLTWWVAPAKCSAIGIGFNGAQTNCGIATRRYIFFSKYYNLQTVHFELLQLGATWCRLVEFGVTWCGMVQFGTILVNLVQFGATWCRLVQFDATWCRLV